VRYDPEEHVQGSTEAADNSILRVNEEVDPEDAKWEKNDLPFSR
jgi:hypothetical protein